jgi:endoglucanase
VEITQAPCLQPIAAPKMAQRAPGIAGRRALLALGLGTMASIALHPRIVAAPAGNPGILHLPPPPPLASSADAPGLMEWRRFRDRFVMRDGRVIDSGNGGVSHSEGQGFAMLLAEWCGDRAAFERILGWTTENLARPRDSLFAWAWRPHQAVAVPDNNNATDGDIAIAWALQRAARRWSMPAWEDLAAAIIADVVKLCTRDIAGRTVLLPGAYGFTRPNACIVNPSYYNFPAIRSLAVLLPGPAMRRLEADGRTLLEAARFGAWRLPPDWLHIDATTGRLTPASGWPPRFSWDAIRVPLYLAWAGLREAPALRAAATFWDSARSATLPAWTDLHTGALSPYAGHEGVRAVAALALSANHAGEGAGRPAFPGVAGAPDYYAAVLIMLARMAALESARLPVADPVLAEGAT